MRRRLQPPSGDDSGGDSQGDSRGDSRGDSQGDSQGDSNGGDSTEEAGAQAEAYDSQCEGGSDCSDCGPRLICQDCPQACRDRAAALVPIIREVLQEAILAGGSSLRDYRQADGDLGYFQHTFRVYGREGAPCVTPECTGQVQRIVQSGRSSFFCGHCQR